MAVGSGWAWDITLLANADMDSYQYHAVTTGSVAGEFKLGNGGSGPIALGVLQNDPKVGQEGQIRMLGKTKAYATIGTAITYGDLLSCGSIGHYELAAGSVYSAIALKALASGTAVIEILLVPTVVSASSDVVDNTP